MIHKTANALRLSATDQTLLADRGAAPATLSKARELGITLIGTSDSGSLTDAVDAPDDEEVVAR